MKHEPIRSIVRDPHEPVLLERAERELAFLRLRRRRLPSRRLSDAHWAILLDLYVANAQKRRVLTKDLVDDAGVAGATLLRYLDTLESIGLIRRVQHAHDARATCIEPTTRGLDRIASILSESPITKPETPHGSQAGGAG